MGNIGDPRRTIEAPESVPESAPAVRTGARVTGRAFRAGFAQTSVEPSASTVFGLREFALRPAHGPLLFSTFIRFHAWKRGTNHAVCRAAAVQGHSLVEWDHEADQTPYQDCACGYWAYTASAGRDGICLVGTRGQGPSVVGVVAAWGRMVGGALGFRAGKARVVALAFPRPEQTARETAWCPWTEMRREAMGGVRLKRAAPAPWEGIPGQQRIDLLGSYPDVEPYRTVEEMLAAHPLSDLSDLTGAA